MKTPDPRGVPAQMGRVTVFAHLRAALVRLAAAVEDGDAWAALSRVQRTSGASAAELYVADPGSDELTHAASAATGPRWMAPVELVEEAFHGAPVLLRTRDELVERMPEVEPRREALLAFALHVDGRSIGAIALHYGGGPDDGDPAEDGVTELTGADVADALETLQLRHVGARRAVEMSQLLKLTDALALAPSAARAAGVVARTGAALLSAAAGLVYLPEADELVLHAASGLRGRELRELRVLPQTSASPYTDAARAGRPLYLPSRRAIGRRYPDVIHPVGAGESLAVMPLLAGEDVMGVVAFGFSGTRSIGASGTDLLLVVARQAAQTLARLRLVEEQHEGLALEGRFQELTDALSAAATPEAVSRIAVELSLPAFRASAAVIALVDPETGALQVRDMEGAGAETIAGAVGAPIRPPHPMVDALHTCEPALLSSPEAIAERYPPLLDGHRGQIRTLAVVPLHSAGRPFGALLIAFPRRRVFTEHERSALRRLSERTSDAIVLGRLLIGEQAARRRSDLLHDVASALNEKADARGVAHTLLGRIVPAVGAVSATVALTDGDLFRPVATAAVGGGTRQRWSAAEAVLARRAIAAGHPIVTAAGDTSASVVVPLAAAGRPVGVLVVAVPRPAMRDVVDTLATVGQVAGAALERAIEHERDHHVAEELQQSLLGRRASSLPNVEAGAGYRPGNAGMRVGGDWHDIVPLPGGRLLLTVGDVVGSGLRAAEAMGQLRSALSALARVVDRPGRLLEHLSEFAESVEAAHYATVSVAILNPDTGELRYASAGHPPPLVVRPDGSSAYLWHGRSEPLACRGFSERPESLAVIPDGGSVVLYTDGLVERREELIDEGLERLQGTIATLVGGGTADLAERILDTALDEGVHHDDAVVLVATMGAAPVRVFHHELPKDAAALAPMRQAAMRWLESIDADPAVRHDLVLVLNEAAANAVEHGEGNDELPIEIRLAFDPRDGVFEGSVSGAGRWREQRPSDRGRGLPIIRNLTDSVTLERRHGTTLSFRRTVRAPAPERAQGA